MLSRSSLIFLQRIDPIKDFENIGNIPCARSSLLYGIGGGAGIGAVRFLSSRRKAGETGRAERTRDWLSGKLGNRSFHSNIYIYMVSMLA